MAKFRGEKTLRILRAIGKASYTTAELFDSIFAGYHESYRSMRGLPPLKKEFKNKQEWREYKRKQIEAEEKHRFYDLISKLKKEGLIKKSKIDKWLNTRKGQLKEKELLLKKKNNLPSGSYSTEKIKEFKIITFDIPEKESRKRRWLRYTLKRLGFKMLHKSVWIGNVKLPEEFINNLRKLRLLPYVEILAITKTGSLKLLK